MTPVIRKLNSEIVHRLRLIVDTRPQASERERLLAEVQLLNEQKVSAMNEV